MEENGTRVPSQPQPKLQQKVIVPEAIDFDIEQAHEEGPKIDQPDILNEPQQTKREDESPLVTLPAVTKILKETAEGPAKILKYQKNRNEYSEEDCFILLKIKML